MKIEEQKLALLEWAGWRQDRLTEKGAYEVQHKVWTSPCGIYHKLLHNLPNLSSLDVIAEFEGKLSTELPSIPHAESVKTRYVSLLFEMCGTKGAVFATTPQRLEVLVRTLGLWKE